MTGSSDPDGVAFRITATSLVHEDICQERLDTPLNSSTVVEKVEYRQRRFGVLLARVTGITAMGWVVNLASAVRRWAEELRCFVVAFDAWNPRWRTASLCGDYCALERFMTRRKADSSYGCRPGECPEHKRYDE